MMVSRGSLLLSLALLVGAPACFEDGEIPDAGLAAPDLYVAEFSLSPATPVEGQPVTVTIGVGNRGRAAVEQGAAVRWFPGEHSAAAACNWTVGGSASGPIVPGATVVITCTYAGYPSWYGSIDTMVVLDAADVIDEGSPAAEENNTFLRNISVTPRQ